MLDTSFPYDAQCPVFYDNDDHRDVYTDEFLLALHSAGHIDLRGMSTTYSFDASEYAEFVDGRARIVDVARESGMRSLPDPIPGPDDGFSMPESERIDDTEPLDEQASHAIVREAATATTDQQLVVITGGPLTTVADAYLIDPSITETVVVASLLGTTQDTSGWNGELDPWATYIVTTQFRYVQFPTYHWPPTVRKPELRRRLPESPLKEWMVEIQHPSNELPDGADNDGQPVVPLVQQNFVKQTVRCAVAGRFDDVCVFREATDGNITVVTDADGHGVGREAFFAALTDPAAYAE